MNHLWCRGGWLRIRTDHFRIMEKRRSVDWGWKCLWHERWSQARSEHVRAVHEWKVMCWMWRCLWWNVFVGSHWEHRPSDIVSWLFSESIWMSYGLILSVWKVRAAVVANLACSRGHVAGKPQIGSISDEAIPAPGAGIWVPRIHCNQSLTQLRFSSVSQIWIWSKSMAQEFSHREAEVCRYWPSKEDCWQTMCTQSAFDFFSSHGGVLKACRRSTRKVGQ